MAEALIHLLRLPSFRRLVLAQAVSEIGDWLTSVALILLVVRLLNNPAAAGLVLLAKLLPRAIIYPFGGLLADAIDRRVIMIGADLLRAALALSLLLVSSTDGLWWALTATALSQALTSLFNPAIMAIVPAIVPEDRLGPANASLGAVRQTAFMLGPLLGSIAISFGDLGLAFVLDALTFALSAALIVGLRSLPIQSAPGRVQSVLADLQSGWAVIRASQPLQMLVVSQVVFSTLVAVLNVLLTPILVLQWQAPETLLGLLYTAIGAGCLLGSMLALRVPSASYINAALLMQGLIGIGAVALGLTPWLWLGLAVLLVIGVATLVGDVTAHASIQSLVADGQLGRVFGLFFWAIAIGQIAGALLGWVAGDQPTAVIVPLGLTALATAAWLLRLRDGRRPAPSMPPPA